MASDQSQTTPTMDQAMARLYEAHGMSPEIKRITVVRNADGELFDAASMILQWMRTLHPSDRHIALFNRLQDAITGVREAHQMDPADVR